MEASKCPKCGEEPFFIEHVEKWYCYGCNTYIEDNANEHVEEAISDAKEPVNEEKAETIAEELRALDEESQLCKNCGATLEFIGDGKLYCYVCENYPEDASAAEEESKANEAQTLLDEARTHVPDIAPAIAPAIGLRTEPPIVKETAPVQIVEEKKVKPIEVKMCSVCGQPLKFIEKYQRHYCYGCRKYAPKEAPVKPSAEAQRTVPEVKVCPDCSASLKFIGKYNEWYCYTCKRYPFHKKKEPTKPKELSCPKCHEPLRWIEKYSRHYCSACKEYAPKGYCGDAHGEKKSCPVCSEEMKYVSEYNEWYCYKCKKYSLRPSKPVLLM